MGKHFYKHWAVGDIRKSPIYKREYRCLARFFIGNLEYVVLAEFPNGYPFLSTAHAVSDPVFPRIRSRGGVARCDHCEANGHKNSDTVYIDQTEWCSDCGMEIIRKLYSLPGQRPGSVGCFFYRAATKKGDKNE